MRIKKSRFNLLVLVFILFIGCSKNNYYNGSANIISITRDLPEFTKIVTQDDLNVNIIQNDKQLVEVTVNDNLQNRIRTNVSNNTLFIALENGSYRNATFEVTIQLPNLERLELNDNTSGTVSFIASTLEFEVNDSSVLSLQGTSEILDVKTNDAGIINGFAFTTKVLNTRSRGASELEITCSNELNGTIYDASKVSYRGMPTVNAQTSEDGQIINAN